MLTGLLTLVQMSLACDKSYALPILFVFWFSFLTSDLRHVIIDFQGHKSYVPNMISGASQADIGVLV